VAIAGGGFAALEAAIGLRAMAATRVDLTLISPDSRFIYRPAATAQAFGEGSALTYSLPAIAGDLGASFHQAALDSVAPKRRELRLSEGTGLAYDALILAIGARARAAIPGALTFRDQRDVERFRGLLDELASGAIQRLAFAVPSRHAWSLPLYELALLSAVHAADHAAKAEIVLVTPEPRPLAVFGAAASRRAADLLAERGVRFMGSTIPHSVRPDGALALQFEAAIEADRVVAVPELYGQRIPGIPGDWSGFVPTDRFGLVEGLSDVYAAGDMTVSPIKQGGLAAQQADRIAHTIAARLGATVKELRQANVLRARLLTGDGALVLRTELDEFGQPTDAAVEHRESRQAEDLKVFGRYLTPYLAMAGPRLASAA
jgi:sulfide:quinone oxidoreductase